MDTQTILPIALVVVFVIGLFVSHWVRRMDKIDSRFDPDAELIPVDSTGVDIEAVLEEFGTCEPGEVPSKHLPLDSGFLHIAGKYSRIVFGDDGNNEPVFDRTMMGEPYPHNPAYVQIGLHDYQDPVLIKRHSQDPRIFYINYDEGSLEFPEECVASFDAYLAQEYKLHKEMLEDLAREEIKARSKRKKWWRRLCKR